jgi:hydroxymethylglutaryl-CoA lyase
MSQIKEKVKIIECPRDAMQGLHDFIHTDTKADYINKLLKAGFDTIDFGSFVSPKTIPQMRDTAEVLSQIDLNASKTKLLAIIANIRGAEDAVKFNEIAYLGFPFSISETFQKRNTNSTISDSLGNIESILHLCDKNKKELVIYISMAFGNPYNDPWNTEIAITRVEQIVTLGVKTIAMADTVGLATDTDVAYLFKEVIAAFPSIEFGAHLHCRSDSWYKKVDAAYRAGCRRFDAAIKGFGGCPMAEDELTGNLATENLIQYLEEKNVETGIDKNSFDKAVTMAEHVFAKEMQRG